MTTCWKPAAPVRPDPTAVPRVPPPAPAGDAGLVTLPLAELEGIVHDLRNHVGSLLLNAGVVASMAADPARAAHFVAQIERDGERCAALLQALAERHLGAVPPGPAP